MPSPSIFAAAASTCRASFSGSVLRDDSRLKSSSDPEPSSDLFPSSAPFTAEVAALEVISPGLFHSVCGFLAIMPSLPVPSLAQSQIPCRGEVSSGFSAILSVSFRVFPWSLCSLMELPRSWGDPPPEFWWRSPGAWGDVSMSGAGRRFSGGVTFRNLSLCSFGLGGVAIAF